MSTRSHDIAWAAPGPLLAAGQGLGRPALLRFATDDFIERLQAVLAEAPSRLAAFRALPETWREPMALPTVAEGAPAPPLSAAAQKLRRLIAGREAVPQATGGSAGPLKLYQPSQMRHYLVAAMLVCRLPGLPDREIDLAAGDRAGFVLRRLLPPGPAPDPKLDPPPFNPATWQEYAWVPGPDGPSWQQLPDPLEAPAGEERLPAFPMRYAEADGRNRRLLAGSVPTGRREAYIGAPVARADAATGRVVTPAPAPKTARLMLLRADVIEPWRRLIDLADQTKLRLWNDLGGDTETRSAAATAIGQARDQIQTASWYILLDLHDLLKKHLPKVVNAISGTPASLSHAEQALVDAMRDMKIPTGLAGALETGGYAAKSVATSLADALASIDAARTGLEAVVAEFARTTPPTRDPQWPSFLFPLADPDPNHLFFNAPGTQPVLGAADGIDPDLALEEPEARQDQQDCVTALEALIIRAMPDASPAPDPAPMPAACAGQEPRDARFVMRPVLDRPVCAPFHSSLVGPGTEPFRIAGFFDSDAPARPVRIGLPLDITPAGLRRFDKKAVVTLSDALCGQLHRMRGLGLGDLVLSVLPWPFHKPLKRAGGAPCTSSSDPSLSLGLVCSLSIPIITLCALILLIIMVTLFDIIFRWIPWFIMCLPVPGLRAKGPK